MRSDPAGLRILRLTSKEPLGGLVIRAPRNTTSIRPSSCFAFSFQLAPLEHLPVLITPGSLLAGATAGSAATTASDAMRMISLRMDPLFYWFQRQENPGK